MSTYILEMSYLYISSKKKAELKITLEILSEILDKATALLKTIAIILKSFTLAITCRRLTGVFNILPKTLGRKNKPFSMPAM